MKHLILFVGLSFVFLSCKKDLVDPSANQITDATTLPSFNEQISNGVSMVFFHAAWCSNCQELRPTIEKIASIDTLSDVTFLEADYDDVRSVFSEYKVEGFPQVLFFSEGVEQERLVGKNQSEDKIIEVLNKYRY